MTFAQLQAYIAKLHGPAARTLSRKWSPSATQDRLPAGHPRDDDSRGPLRGTTGRRGAIGVGIGIVLAIACWITMGISGALGAGSAMSPMLAA